MPLRLRGEWTSRAGNARQLQFVGQMARDPVVGRCLAPRRNVGLADILGILAARVELAARRRIARAGHVAGQQDALHFVVGVGAGHRREERLGVGVTRRGVELLGRRQLHDAAQIHHGDPVADVLHDREIMRDEQVGKPQVLLQIVQQVEHLRLDRDIQRAHRLVADDELRVEREFALS